MAQRGSSGAPGRSDPSKDDTKQKRDFTIWFLLVPLFFVWLFNAWLDQSLDIVANHTDDFPALQKKATTLVAI